jgi:predicted MFS family arabinose efflux permease
MLAYMMIAILAVLAFLCISHAIPAMARRKTLSNSLSEVDSEATALRYTHPHARSLSLAKQRK